MRRSNWLHGLRASLGRSRRSSAYSAKWRPTATRRPKFEPLEDRHLLALDYGDAPDSALGSGPGNYNTRTADGALGSQATGLDDGRLIVFHFSIGGEAERIDRRYIGT